MSEQEHDEHAGHDHEENDLLKAQEGKGYGEDEGERDEVIDDAAPDDDEQ